MQYFYQDSCIYLSLADSLTHGRYDFYGEPTQKYRPGYPAAIAMFRLFSFFELSYVAAAKSVSFLSRILLIPLVYLLTFRLAGTGPARISAFFAALHVAMILYGTLIYSSIMAVLFILLSFLFMFDKMEVKSGLAAGITALIRPEGVFLLPARMVWNRHWKGIVFFLGAYVAVYAAWPIRNFIIFGHMESSAYLNEIQRNTHSGINFIITYIFTAGPIVLPGAIAGLVLQGKKRETLSMAVFVVLHGLLHTWWWWNDERFLIQVLPILFIFAGIGYGKLISILPRKSLRFAMGGVIIMLTALHSLFNGGALFHEEMERSVPYVKALKHLASAFEPAGIITGDPALVEQFGGFHPTGSWHDSTQAPLEMLFRTYHTRNVRFLIFSDKYQTDYRFQKLLSTQPVTYNIMVKCPDGYHGYEMVVTPFYSGEESIPVCRRDPDCFYIRRELHFPVVTMTFTIDLHTIELVPGSRMEAFMIDDPSCCELIAKSKAFTPRTAALIHGNPPGNRFVAMTTGQ